MASGSVYSGASVTFVSEVLKYPILAVAVAFFDSPKAILPTFWASVTQPQWTLAWVGFAYAAQNLMYFVCLQNISASAYQVLSQFKLMFTAGLMRALLKKKFTRNQKIALLMLGTGAAATQLGEVKAIALGVARNPLLGGSLTILSAFFSALPNVFYERLLKTTDSSSEWVTNIQLTTSILVWVSLLQIGGAFWNPATAGAMPSFPSVATLTRGFTPAVWVIVFLKTLNCIIIPMCLKYADNILYGYAKPVSIVLTCVCTTVLTSSLPPSMTLVGIAMVLLSMALYSKN